MSKTVQIWGFLASTTSSRFERVSRVEIEPNELHAYAKNIGTLNRLCLRILEKFARVSLRFIDVEKFTTSQNTSILTSKSIQLPPSLPPHNHAYNHNSRVHNQLININMCPRPINESHETRQVTMTYNFPTTRT